MENIEKQVCKSRYKKIYEVEIIHDETKELKEIFKEVLKAKDYILEDNNKNINIEGEKNLE